MIAGNGCGAEIVITIYLIGFLTGLLIEHYCGSPKESIECIAGEEKSKGGGK